MPAKKTVKKESFEKLHNEQMEEIREMKELVYLIGIHSTELEKDLREARTLLFMTIAVLLALLGLVLGAIIRLLI